MSDLPAGFYSKHIDSIVASRRICSQNFQGAHVFFPDEFPPGFRGADEGVLDFKVAVGSLTCLGVEEGAASTCRKLRMLQLLVGWLVGW